MDVIAFLRVLRRHWISIVALAVAGGIVGTAVGLLTREENATITGKGRFYTAATTVSVTSTSPVASGQSLLNLDQIALFATTGEVPGLVAQELGLEPREVLDRITTETNQSTGTLTITAIDRDDDDAALIADTAAAVLSNYVVETAERDFAVQLAAANKRVDAAREGLNQLQATQPGAGAPLGEVEAWRAQLNIRSAQLSRAYSGLTDLAERAEQRLPIRAIDSAEAVPVDEATYMALLDRARSGDANRRSGTPSEAIETVESSGSSAPKGPVATGLLGTMLGIMLGTGVALTRDRLDRRLQEREDVEAAYGLPVLAEVPALRRAQRNQPEIASVTAPMSRSAEAYRSIRSMLQFAQVGAPRRDASPSERRAFVVMVVSGHPREGKTTVTANLAAVFAEGGERVLAFNCDFRRPSLHTQFGVEDRPSSRTDTGIDGLSLVSNLEAPNGTSPAQVAEAQQQLLDRARRLFDVVIIDTAPLLTTNDAINLVGHVDAVVVVTRLGGTKVDSARRVAELLSRVGAPVMGVVAIGARHLASSYYAYSYAYQKDRATGAAPREGAPLDIPRIPNGGSENAATAASPILWAPAPPDPDPAPEVPATSGGLPVTSGVLRRLASQIRDSSGANGEDAASP